MKNHLLLFFFLVVSGFSLRAQQYLDPNIEYFMYPQHVNFGRMYVNPANNLLSFDDDRYNDDNGKFQFIPHPELKGQFFIKAKEGTKYLMVVNTPADPFALEWVNYRSNIRPEQLFSFELVGGGSHRDPNALYKISSQYTIDQGSKRVIGIEYGSSSDNAKAVLTYYDGSNSQKFKFHHTHDYLQSKVITDGNPYNDYTVNTTLGGGEIIQKNSGPVYDPEIMKDSSKFFTIALRDIENWVSHFAWVKHIQNGNVTYTEYFMDGESVGNDEAFNIGDYIKSNLFPDGMNNFIPEYKAYHLLTIKKPGKIFYLPFYIVQANVISSILGSLTTPPIPQLILHDPPGDESYSYLKANSQICHGIGMSLQTDASVGLYSNIRLGAKGSLGFIYETEYEIYGELSASATMGVSTTSTGGHEVCLSTATEYSTVGGDLIGTDGDVYIGFEQGLDYGIQTELECDYWKRSPRYVKDKSQIVFAPSQTLATTKFIYTESHIKNSLIPDLVKTRDNPSSNPKEIENAKDKIEVWNQILVLNQENLEEPGPVLDPVNFSGKTSKNEEIEVSTSGTQSFDMNVYLDEEVGLEVGAHVNGSGASGGVKVKVRTELGKTVTNTNTYTNTIGYHLEDGEEGDYFAANVFSDKVFGTPMFELIPNQTASSCPYEGGVNLDQPGLQVASNNSNNFGTNATVNNLSPDEKALYRLKIANEGPIERTFFIRTNPNTNPDGAIIVVDGQAIPGSNSSIDFTIAENSTLSPPKVLSLERGPDPSVNNYGPIELILYSDCDPDVQSVVTISANFSTTSVLDLDQDATNLQIAPNPNNGVFSISLDAAYQGGNLEISDLAGKVVFKQQVGLDFNNMQVQLPNARPGMYIVRAVSDAKHISKKLIIK